MYSVEYSRDALRALIRLPRPARELIRAKIDEMALAPAESQNVKALVGRPGYRLRVGDWRVIFVIDAGRVLVRVLQIGSRGGVSRGYLQMSDIVAIEQIRVIEEDGKPAFYVLPASLWGRVRDAVEDAQDVAAYDRAKAEDDGARFPSAVVYAIVEGATPLRAWRELRGMTLQALADAAGVSKPYVSQIEHGKRTGSAATLARLAKALDVGLEVLVV